MPKRVDHEQRRRQIAEALWRLASEHGLEDVTLRRVAAEAGVSTRLVQYYFGTRDELLTKALDILNLDSERQAQELIAAEGEPTPRGVLRAVLTEMLPLDERRRTRFLVHLAYFVRALSDDSLATAFRDSPALLETTIADVISWGQRTGEVPADLNPVPEAELLLNSIDGLQSGIVLGLRSVAESIALIDYQLDRVFTR